MTETAHISANIPLSLYKKLKQEADDKEVNLSDVIVERLSGSPGPSAPKAEAGVPQSLGAPPLLNSDKEAIDRENTRATTAIWKGSQWTEPPGENLDKLSDEELKRKMKIREERRKQEKHEIDQMLKSQKLLKHGQKVPCPIGGCAAEKQGLTFKNEEELEEHYWMQHKDRLAELPGREVGKWR